MHKLDFRSALAGMASNAPAQVAASPFVPNVISMRNATPRMQSRWRVPFDLGSIHERESRVRYTLAYIGT